MSFYQTVWYYIPTPNQPIAFILAIVVSGMLFTAGVKLIKSASKQK
ncbi:MAG: hypothetical protein ABSC06_23510 [Rhodopila sp.]|jgi:hypothetical protein